MGVEHPHDRERCAVDVDRLTDGFHRDTEEIVHHRLADNHDTTVRFDVAGIEHVALAHEGVRRDEVLVVGTDDLRDRRGGIGVGRRARRCDDGAGGVYARGEFRVFEGGSVLQGQLGRLTGRPACDRSGRTTAESATTAAGGGDCEAVRAECLDPFPDVGGGAVGTN